MDQRNNPPQSRSLRRLLRQVNTPNSAGNNAGPNNAGPSNAPSNNAPINPPAPNALAIAPNTAGPSTAGPSTAGPSTAGGYDWRQEAGPSIQLHIQLTGAAMSNTMSRLSQLGPIHHSLQHLEDQALYQQQMLTQMYTNIQQTTQINNQLRQQMQQTTQINNQLL